MRPQAQRLKFVGGDVYTMALDLTISDYSGIEVLVIDDDADIVELVVALFVANPVPWTQVCLTRRA